MGLAIEVSRDGIQASKIWCPRNFPGIFPGIFLGKGFLIGILASKRDRMGTAKPFEMSIPEDSWGIDILTIGIQFRYSSIFQGTGFFFITWIPPQEAH